MPDPTPEDVEAVAVTAFWDACAGTDIPHMTEAVRVAARAVVAHLGGVGVCGDQAPLTSFSRETAFCELLAGHTGWHEAANNVPPPMRWSWREESE